MMKFMSFESTLLYIANVLNQHADWYERRIIEVFDSELEVNQRYDAMSCIHPHS